MEITRKTLCDGEMLQIGVFEARHVRESCGDVEWQDANAMVLVFGGVFSKHDAPGRHVVGTPSHAVFVAANKPYRVGYPGGIGDRALVLRFDDALAPDQMHARGDEAIASHGLLPAKAMVLRNLLLRRLQKGELDRFGAEAFGLDLLDMSLQSMRDRRSPPRRSALQRWGRALERVKEAIACDPGCKWSVAELARIANLSPFHLCRVFRQMIGLSVHEYVLQERLAGTLDTVLDGDGDLTAIALDAGFASHSHFTARFRRFFGCTPAALRRVATAEEAVEMRKIVTAPGRRLL